MAIAIYREISTGAYSIYGEYDAGDGLLPIITTHDGVLGEVVETKLFVRNDDSTEYYTSVSVIPVSLDSPSDVTGTATGHGAKLLSVSAIDDQPTESEWDVVDYASSMSLDDIGSALAGDTSTYLPFWYRIECPAGAQADNKENVVLRLSYTANAV